MSTEKETPEIQEQAKQAEETNQVIDPIRENLQRITSAAFGKYLNTRFPNGEHEKLSEDEIQELFGAFSCGFNSGIFQAAGETLSIVGVNLNEVYRQLQSINNPETEKDKAEE